MIKEESGEKTPADNECTDLLTKGFKTKTEASVGI